MATIEAQVRIGAMLSALGLSGMVIAGRKADDRVKMDVHVEQGDINEAAEDVEAVTAIAPDLRDGLQALMAGDRGMAKILLLRAFDADNDAKAAVQEVIR